MIRSILVTLCFIAIFTSSGWAQTGSWFIGTVQLPGGDRRWGGFVEAQVRMNNLFHQYNYHEYKGGISYDLGQNFTTLLGAGRYVTYDYRERGAGPLTQEFRMWQQLIINQSLERLKFEHRYRVEQRWQNHRDRPDEYRNRIRYRFNMAVPLNNPRIGPQTVFASTYNEIFLNNRAPHFERNRFYAGLGYQTNSHWVFQVGWLNQYDFSPGLPRSKNNLVCTVVYRINRANNDRQRLPTPVD